MSMLFQSRRDQPNAFAFSLKTFTCLLLALLLLYNPFITFLHSHSGLTIHHPPSNRSTVGSSELQHFSPVGKSLKAAVSTVVCLGEIRMAVAEHDYPESIESSSIPVSLPEFSSNLWFRPPPSA
jgi:hypothetical protein